MDLVTRMARQLPRLLADVEELVTCESPSCDPVALARSTDLVADLGRRHLGAAPERVRAGERVHLRWRLGDGPARVLLLGHHDTVWPLGSLRTHPFAVTDGVLRGPGCVDMKAGPVLALHTLAELDAPAGVTLLVTSDEELGSPTSRELVEQEAAGCAAALVLEAAAAGGALKTERKGVSRYLVRVHGHAAHAGLEPERGVNATVELAHQVLALAALADPARGTTVTPTQATSGTSADTVPAGAAVGGGSDGNFTAGIGTPTLDGLGAVGGGAHADDEHVLVDTLPGRAALIAGLVADLLASEARP
jgi:glutamate carboxypeptidase